MRRHSHYGWMELIIGILLILMGIVTFMRPGSALTAIVMIYGLLATLTGIVDIVFYVKMEHYIGIGPTISLVTGVLSVMAGLMLFVYPGAGRWAMSLLFPLWFITHCLSRLSHASFIHMTAGKGYYYFTVTVNIIGLVLGFLMLIKPYAALFSLNAVVGVYLILLGIDSLVLAMGKLGRKW